MASGVIFEEIECKTIINKVNARGWHFNYTINPYRGCQHACTYCFARGTHQYLGYDSGRDFESRIIVKMKYEITRQLLQVLLDFAQPVHTLTKSPSITRDLELWSRLAAATDAQVAFSVPTLDVDVWKRTEPGSGHPLKRLQAMRRLVDAAYPAAS